MERMDAALEDLSARLARLAMAHDLSGDWPADSLRLLGDFDCWRWIVPQEHGGFGWPASRLVKGYEAIGRGCLTTALVFTQHDAAIDLIVTGDNESLKKRLCSESAEGRRLLTVGISQLTTSHQGAEPAMKAAWNGKTVRFEGLMPWVTSAKQADLIATGGVLPDGRQILACVPSDARGLKIGDPLELAALQATHTCAVVCEGVDVDASYVIRGPVAKALGIRGAVRPMVVSATGLGLAGAMLSEILQVAPRRNDELRTMATGPLSQAYETVRSSLYAAADALSDPDSDRISSEVRVAVNELLMRLMIVLVTFAKGTGYLKSHTAQRLAREALFFLVWSAPDTIQTQTLARFVGYE